jgi:hypothetical protein
MTNGIISQQSPFGGGKATAFNNPFMVSFTDLKLKGD